VDEFLGRVQRAQLPNRSFRAQQHLTSVTFEEDNKAVVWVTADAHGSPGGTEKLKLVREWVVRMHWARRKTTSGDGGTWVCGRMEALSLAGGLMGAL